MAKPRTANTPRRSIRCYFCGHHFDVSELTMSVPCPRCNKALKVEDVHVKTYIPVNDLQTCGKITVAKNGRVVAKVIRAGSGIDCEGTLEGAIEADDHMTLSERSTWKGKTLLTRSLVVADGAKLHGHVKVPWERPVPPPTATTPGRPKPVAVKATGSKVTTEIKPGALAAPPTQAADEVNRTPVSSADEPAMP
jgi:hypothetical protein